MIPIKQTDLTFETGNCGEACVASILEIKLTDIPPLHNPDDPSDGHTYCRNLRNFLNQFGLSYIDVEMADGHHATEFFKDCWIIATGPSPRGTDDWHKHGVVWRNGKIIHDPHPSNSGLNKIDMYGIFIKRNPAQTT